MSLDEDGKLDFDNFANSLEATVADTDLVFEYIQLGGYAVMFPIFTAFGLGLYVLMKVTSKKKFDISDCICYNEIILINGDAYETHIYSRLRTNTHRMR